jgi:phage N-6-adenine-methyltransferase
VDDPDKQIIHSSDESNWRTPPELFKKLNEEADFGIDLAADRANALCMLYLGPEGRVENALESEWSVYKTRGFLNPPYSRKKYRETKDPAMLVENWARKAFNESERGFTTYGLFPFAPQTEWFRLYVMGHTQDGNGWRGHAATEVRRFPYRLSFLRPDGSPAQNAGVNSCVIIWKPNPGYVGPWMPVERYWSFK